MNQPPLTIVAGGRPAPAIPPPRRSFHGHRGKNAPKVPNRTHQDARSRILIETPRPGGLPPLETSGRNSRLTHNRLFPGRRRCCDVAYLSQAFSQHTGPGRLWISLGTILLPDSLSRDGQNQTMN